MTLEADSNNTQQVWKKYKRIYYQNTLQVTLKNTPTLSNNMKNQTLAMTLALLLFIPAALAGHLAFDGSKTCGTNTTTTCAIEDFTILEADSNINTLRAIYTERNETHGINDLYFLDNNTKTRVLPPCWTNTSQLRQAAYIENLDKLYLSWFTAGDAGLNNTCDLTNAAVIASFDLTAESYARINYTNIHHTLQENLHATPAGYFINWTGEATPKEHLAFTFGNLTYLVNTTGTFGQTETQPYQDHADNHYPSDYAYITGGGPYYLGVDTHTGCHYISASNNDTNKQKLYASEVYRYSSEMLRPRNNVTIDTPTSGYGDWRPIGSKSMFINETGQNIVFFDSNREGQHELYAKILNKSCLDQTGARRLTQETGNDRLASIGQAETPISGDTIVVLWQKGSNQYYYSTMCNTYIPSINEFDAGACFWNLSSTFALVNEVTDEEEEEEGYTPGTAETTVTSSGTKDGLTAFINSTVGLQGGTDYEYAYWSYKPVNPTRAVNVTVEVQTACDLNAAFPVNFTLRTFASVSGVYLPYDTIDTSSYAYCNGSDNINYSLTFDFSSFDFQTNAKYSFRLESASNSSATTSGYRAFYTNLPGSLYVNENWLGDYLIYTYAAGGVIKSGSPARLAQLNINGTPIDAFYLPARGITTTLTYQSTIQSATIPTTSTYLAAYAPLATTWGNSRTFWWNVDHNDTCTVNYTSLSHSLQYNQSDLLICDLMYTPADSHYFTQCTVQFPNKTQIYDTRGYNGHQLTIQATDTCNQILDFKPVIALTDTGFQHAREGIYLIYNESTQPAFKDCQGDIIGNGSYCTPYGAVHDAYQYQYSPHAHHPHCAHGYNTAHDACYCGVEIIAKNEYCCADSVTATCETILCAEGAYTNLSCYSETLYTMLRSGDYNPTERELEIGGIIEYDPKHQYRLFTRTLQAGTLLERSEFNEGDQFHAEARIVDVINDIDLTFASNFHLYSVSCETRYNGTNHAMSLYYDKYRTATPVTAAYDGENTGASYYGSKPRVTCTITLSGTQIANLTALNYAFTVNSPTQTANCADQLYINTTPTFTQQTTTSVLVNFTTTNHSTPGYDLYEDSLGNTLIKNKINPSEGYAHSILVEGLQPGKTYYIRPFAQMWCVNHHVNTKTANATLYQFTLNQTEDTNATGEQHDTGYVRLSDFARLFKSGDGYALTRSKIMNFESSFNETLTCRYERTDVQITRDRCEAPQCDQKTYLIAYTGRKNNVLAGDADDPQFPLVTNRIITHDFKGDMVISASGETTLLSDDPESPDHYGRLSKNYSTHVIPSFKVAAATVRNYSNESVTCASAYALTGPLYNFTHTDDTTTYNFTNSTMTLFDDSDSQTIMVGNTINFYANYTNRTSGQTITGATCRVKYHDHTPIYAMTFNPSNNLYYHNRTYTYSQKGTQHWNVTCEHVNHSYANATNTVTTEYGSLCWVNGKSEVIRFTKDDLTRDIQQDLAANKYHNVEYKPEHVTMIGDLHILEKTTALKPSQFDVYINGQIVCRDAQNEIRAVVPMPFTTTLKNYRTSDEGILTPVNIVIFLVALPFLGGILILLERMGIYRRPEALAKLMSLGREKRGRR